MPPRDPKKAPAATASPVKAAAARPVVKKAAPSPVKPRVKAVINSAPAVAEEVFDVLEVGKEEVPDARVRLSQEDLDRMFANNLRRGHYGSARAVHILGANPNTLISIASGKKVTVFNLLALRAMRQPDPNHPDQKKNIIQLMRHLRLPAAPGMPVPKHITPENCPQRVTLGDKPTLMHRFAQYGDPELMKAFFPVRGKPKDDSKALPASVFDSMSTQKSAKAKADGDQGESPLHLAIQERNYPMVRCLVDEMGVNVNIRRSQPAGVSPDKNPGGYTPLDEAVVRLKEAASGDDQEVAAKSVTILIFLLGKRALSMREDTRQEVAKAGTVVVQTGGKFVSNALDEVGLEIQTKQWSNKDDLLKKVRACKVAVLKQSLERIIEKEGGIKRATVAAKGVVVGEDADFTRFVSEVGVVDKAIEVANPAEDAESSQIEDGEQAETGEAAEVDVVAAGVVPVPSSFDSQEVLGGNYQSKPATPTKTTKVVAQDSGAPTAILPFDDPAQEVIVSPVRESSSDSSSEFSTDDGEEQVAANVVEEQAVAASQDAAAAESQVVQQLQQQQELQSAPTPPNAVGDVEEAEVELPLNSFGLVGDLSGNLYRRSVTPPEAPAAAVVSDPNAPIAIVHASVPDDGRLSSFRVPTPEAVPIVKYEPLNVPPLRSVVPNIPIVHGEDFNSEFDGPATHLTGAEFSQPLRLQQPSSKKESVEDWRSSGSSSDDDWDDDPEEVQEAVVPPVIESAEEVTRSRSIAKAFVNNLREKGVKIGIFDHDGTNGLHTFYNEFVKYQLFKSGFGTDLAEDVTQEQLQASFIDPQFLIDVLKEMEGANITPVILSQQRTGPLNKMYGSLPYSDGKTVEQHIVEQGGAIVGRWDGNDAPKITIKNGEGEFKVAPQKEPRSGGVVKANFVEQLLDQDAGVALIDDGEAKTVKDGLPQNSAFVAIGGDDTFTNYRDLIAAYKISLGHGKDVRGETLPKTIEEIYSGKLLSEGGDPAAFSAKLIAERRNDPDFMEFARNYYRDADATIMRKAHRSKDGEIVFAGEEYGHGFGFNRELAARVLDMERGQDTVIDPNEIEALAANVKAGMDAIRGAERGVKLEPKEPENAADPQPESQESIVVAIPDGEMPLAQPFTLSIIGARPLAVNTIEGLARLYRDVSRRGTLADLFSHVFNRVTAEELPKLITEIAAQNKGMSPLIDAATRGTDAQLTFLRHDKQTEAYQQELLRGMQGLYQAHFAAADEKFAELVNATDAQGNTAIELAIAQGHYKLANDLVSVGAIDVNAKASEAAALAELEQSANEDAVADDADLEDVTPAAEHVPLAHLLVGKMVKERNTVEPPVKRGWGILRRGVKKDGDKSPINPEALDLLKKLTDIKYLGGLDNLRATAADGEGILAVAVKQATQKNDPKFLSAFLEHVPNIEHLGSVQIELAMMSVKSKIVAPEDLAGKKAKPLRMGQVVENKVWSDLAAKLQVGLGSALKMEERVVDAEVRREFEELGNADVEAESDELSEAEEVPLANISAAGSDELEVNLEDDDGQDLRGGAPKEGGDEPDVNEPAAQGLTAFERAVKSKKYDVAADIVSGDAGAELRSDGQKPLLHQILEAEIDSRRNPAPAPAAPPRTWRSVVRSLLPSKKPVTSFEKLLQVAAKDHRFGVKDADIPQMPEADADADIVETEEPKSLLEKAVDDAIGRNDPTVLSQVAKHLTLQDLGVAEINAARTRINPEGAKKRGGSWPKVDKILEEKLSLAKIAENPGGTVSRQAMAAVVAGSQLDASPQGGPVDSEGYTIVPDTDRGFSRRDPVRDPDITEGEEEETGAPKAVARRPMVRINPATSLGPAQLQGNNQPDPFAPLSAPRADSGNTFDVTTMREAEDDLFREPPASAPFAADPFAPQDISIDRPPSGIASPFELGVSTPQAGVGLQLSTTVHSGEAPLSSTSALDPRLLFQSPPAPIPDTVQAAAMRYIEAEPKDKATILKGQFDLCLDDASAPSEKERVRLIDAIYTAQNRTPFHDAILFRDNGMPPQPGESQAGERLLRLMLDSFSLPSLPSEGVDDDLAVVDWADQGDPRKTAFDMAIANKNSDPTFAKLLFAAGADTAGAAIQIAQNAIELRKEAARVAATDKPKAAQLTKQAQETIALLKYFADQTALKPNFVDVTHPAVEEDRVRVTALEIVVKDAIDSDDPVILSDLLDIPEMINLKPETVEKVLKDLKASKKESGKWSKIGPKLKKVLAATQAEAGAKDLYQALAVTSRNDEESISALEAFLGKRFTKVTTREQENEDGLLVEVALEPHEQYFALPEKSLPNAPTPVEIINRSKSSDGEPLTHVLAKQGRVNALIELLKYGDPNIVNPRSGKSLLDVAVETGDPKIVEIVALYACASTVDDDTDKTTPLHRAAIGLRVAVLNKDKDNAKAVKKVRDAVEIIRILDNHRHSAFVPDRSKENPLQMLQKIPFEQCKSDEMFDAARDLAVVNECGVMKDFGEMEEGVFVAAAATRKDRDQERQGKELYAKATNPKFKDDSARVGAILKPLLTEKRESERATLLKEKRRIAARDAAAQGLSRDDGAVAIDAEDEATIDQNIATIINKSRSSKKVPLVCVMAREGQLLTVRELLEQGADVNSVDRTTGETLLHIAVASGKPELVDEVLAKNPTTNAKFGPNTTSFHVAARRFRKAVDNKQTQEIADAIAVMTSLKAAGHDPLLKEKLVKVRFSTKVGRSAPEIAQEASIQSCPQTVLDAAAKVRGVVGFEGVAEAIDNETRRRVDFSSAQKMANLAKQVKAAAAALEKKQKADDAAAAKARKKAGGDAAAAEPDDEPKEKEAGWAAKLLKKFSRPSRKVRPAVEGEHSVGSADNDESIAVSSASGAAPATKATVIAVKPAVDTEVEIHARCESAYSNSAQFFEIIKGRVAGLDLDKDRARRVAVRGYNGNTELFRSLITGLEKIQRCTTRSDQGHQYEFDPDFEGTQTKITRVWTAKYSADSVGSMRDNPISHDRCLDSAEKIALLTFYGDTVTEFPEFYANVAAAPQETLNKFNSAEAIAKATKMMQYFMKPENLRAIEKWANPKSDAFLAAQETEAKKLRSDPTRPATSVASPLAEVAFSKGKLKALIDHTP